MCEYSYKDEWFNKVIILNTKLKHNETSPFNNQNTPL